MCSTSALSVEICYLGLAWGLDILIYSTVQQHEEAFFLLAIYGHCGEILYACSSVLIKLHFN